MTRTGRKRGVFSVLTLYVQIIQGKAVLKGTRISNSKDDLLNSILALL